MSILDDTTLPIVSYTEQPTIPITQPAEDSIFEKSTLPLDIDLSTATPTRTTVKEYKFSQPNYDGTSIDVTHVTATEQFYEDPNSSVASTIRTLSRADYVEMVESEEEEKEQTTTEEPRFIECTREHEVSFETTPKTFCDLCGTTTDHGGCKARNLGGCDMNCCRKYLEYDPDYTRQLTPDNTRDDDEEEHYYSDEIPTEEDEDEDMDENEEEDYDMEEENTTESSDHGSYDVDSDGHRTLGLPPTETERSSENERAATPGVSKEVGKLSLDDVQPNEQETEEEEEVQIVGEVQHQSDDEQPKVRKNRKPTQRRN